jgi:hypothetical protein
LAKLLILLPFGTFNVSAETDKLRHNTLAQGKNGLGKASISVMLLQGQHWKHNNQVQ